MSFGAFVDLGGMDGLIHVSELSWKHVDHPGAVVTVGDKVTVQVLDVDFDRERISLSIKQAAEGGELAEEYRSHFEIDEHGNWTAGQDDAEREAAWAEYYQENPDEKPPTEGDAEVAAVEADAEVEADVAAEAAPEA